MPKGLIDIPPEKFDLNNPYLCIFLNKVACSLDAYRLGRVKEEDYKNIYLASEILKRKSRDFRIGKEDVPFDSLFFWEFYGKEEEERDFKKTRELCADRLLILSERLDLIKELPKEEVEELETICVNLSRKTQEYKAQRSYVR